MTKKDFVFIASTVASIKDVGVRKSVAWLFANHLGVTNSRFNEGKFFEKCNVTFVINDDDTVDLTTGGT